MFWALFGLSDARRVEIGQGFQSRFTESVGYIVFGVYNWAVVIVLLNMLIAMMTRSFEKITVSTQRVGWEGGMVAGVRGTCGWEGEMLGRRATWWVEWVVCVGGRAKCWVGGQHGGLGGWYVWVAGWHSAWGVWYVWVGGQNIGWVIRTGEWLLNVGGRAKYWVGGWVVQMGWSTQWVDRWYLWVLGQHGG